MTHMTTCAKYPIGSNALWEGYSSFSGSQRMKTPTGTNLKVKFPSSSRLQMIPLQVLGSLGKLFAPIKVAFHPYSASSILKVMAGSLGYSFTDKSGYP